MTYFELVLEEIFLGGNFAVEAEKTLFVGREGLIREYVFSFSACMEGGEWELTLMSTLFF